MSRTLEDELKIAQLRAKCLWFTYEVPEEFLRNRTRSAYDSGYEAGWRGWPYGSFYARPHFQSAYRHGYSDATTRLHEEARAHVCEYNPHPSDEEKRCSICQKLMPIL